MILTTMNLSEQEIGTINVIVADQGKTPQKKRDDITEILGGNAFTIDDAKWEAILTLTSKAAAEVADGVANQSSSKDKTTGGIFEEVILPLRTFSEAFEAEKRNWLLGNFHKVNSLQNTGLLMSLNILTDNHVMRISLTTEYNAKVQKTAVIGGSEIVIMTATSEFSKQKLIPMSTRDQTIQLSRVSDFVQSNIDGFIIF